MNWITQIFSRRRIYSDISEELQQHLEEKTEDLIRAGMSREDATAAAHREFGNMMSLRGRSREVWQWSAVEDFLSDLQYAGRQLRKSPAFTLAAVLTLALGIGANTAVFSVVSAVVLRPLPFPQPDRLVSVQSLNTRNTPIPDSLSYPNFFDFRANNHVFDHIVCYRDDNFTLTGLGQPVHLDDQIVSWDLFPLLGVQPAMGRGFLPEEEKPGTHVVILSHQLWQGQFSGDPSIIGRPVTMDGETYAVVGVAPAGFHFPVENQTVQLWTTLARDASVSIGHPLTVQRGAKVLNAIARLKQGVTLDHARAEMDAIAAALARQHPDENTNIARTHIQPELEWLLGDTSKALWILMGAVGLVLLIACGNIANLLLARTAEREREFAVRAAIGASRHRVIRQLLTESLLLALVGSITGVLLAMACMHLVLPFGGDSIPRVRQAGIDGRVLVFSIVLALFTSVLFSLAPALQLAKVELVSSLKEGTRSIARGHDRLRSALVIGQIALGLVLLSGAGMLTASFLYLQNRDPGFKPDHLLTFSLSLPEAPYSRTKQVDFYDRLFERLSRLPGVQSAAGGGPLPLSGSQMSVSFNIPERPSAPANRPHSDMAIVTPGYFRTLGIPLLHGRHFTQRDDAKSAQVVIVNKAFADKFFPGEDVIGRRIEPGATADGNGTKIREIVGVVGNAKQSAIGVDFEPIYYFPYKQLPWFIESLALRTSVSSLSLESAVRAEVTSLDKQVPISGIRTMEDVRSESIAQPRFLMLLLGSFAGIGLLLTVVGLYGVMTYSVMKRTREIGVRIAVGADRMKVLTLVLKQAMMLVGAGILIGLAGAPAGGQLLRNMLYGVAPGDPLLMAIACIVITATGGIATYLPARRAASTDPMQALRAE